MLGIRNKLVFPKLIWMGEGPIIKGDIDSRRGIYRLDWADFDGQLRKKHERWNETHWPKKDFPYKSTLPPEYDLLLRDVHFAVNQSYSEEIHRNCRRALVEWNTYRGFDTCVREMCLEPGQSHIWVAFKLLTDCLYDSDAKYFHRGPEKWFLANAMVYKFWGHQTGSGLLWRNAKLDELGERVEGKHVDSEVRKAATALIKAIDAREQESNEIDSIGDDELDEDKGVKKVEKVRRHVKGLRAKTSYRTPRKGG